MTASNKALKTTSQLDALIQKANDNDRLIAFKQFQRPKAKALRQSVPDIEATLKLLNKIYDHKYTPKTPEQLVRYTRVQFFALDQLFRQLFSQVDDETFLLTLKAQRLSLRAYKKSEDLKRFLKTAYKRNRQIDERNSQETQHAQMDIAPTARDFENLPSNVIPMKIGIQIYPRASGFRLSPE